MDKVIVIPARMASTRFPAKPLARISGISMIERVWRIAKAVPRADRVLIATDSEELREHCLSFGAEVAMTSSECRTGSDRVAEAILQLSESVEFVLGLQGDAVLTPPWVIDAMLEELESNSDVGMVTPAVELLGDAKDEYIEEKRRGSTSGTGVVFSKRGDALYFSKSLIPFAREGSYEDVSLYRHIGLYGFRREILLKFVKLEEGSLERVEKLEQLRALENDIPIRVVLVDYRGRTPASVDNPEDVPYVERIIADEGELLA